MKSTLIACAFACVALNAMAHGGEDHGEVAAAPVQVGQAPRAAAQTDDFELVMVLTGAQVSGEPEHDHPAVPPVLTLYLDRFATNAPVGGATVEVESGAFKAVAKQVEPGVYTVAGQTFAKPGRYPLTVSVQTDDGADLLEASLQYEAPKTAEPASAPAWRKLGGWIGGLALVLIIAGWAWRRRRAGTSSIES
ncbi:MAG: hypothetical protein V4532_17365 [Pseudomonadota bacterium]